MWRQIQRSGAWAVLGVVCAWGGAAAAAETSATAAQRVQTLQQTALPQAHAALQRHLQHCDTQLAVLHARRAMAMAEDGSDSGVWLDMEVLTAQCQVTAQQLRTTATQLETELLQLQTLQEKSTPSAPVKR